MRLEIVQTGDYYRAQPSDAPLPPLGDLVKAECRERPRRTDRYTRLALIGSARCADGVSLDAETGLYIGSRFAGLGNTIQVQEEMLGAGQAPKPAHFINTLSNSAGYHVARNLGLTGRNLFVSRYDASLMAALQLVRTDFANGVVTRALVGVVEELALPLSHQRRRLGVPGDTPLAEGSHWFLLRPAPAGGGEVVIDQVTTLPDRAALADWLAGLAASSGEEPLLYLYGRASHNAPAPVLPSWARFEPDPNEYPAAVGGALMRYLASGLSAPLVCLVNDGEGRFHGLLCQKGRAG